MVSTPAECSSSCSARAVMQAAWLRGATDRGGYEANEQLNLDGLSDPLESKGAHSMTMTRLRLNITMSLDGYVAGPNQSTAHPLGEGAEHLHDWLFKLKTFRAIHGDTNGGETGTNDD